MPACTALHKGLHGATSGMAAPEYFTDPDACMQTQSRLEQSLNQQEAASVQAGARMLSNGQHLHLGQARGIDGMTAGT